MRRATLLDIFIAMKTGQPINHSKDNGVTRELVYVQSIEKEDGSGRNWNVRVQSPGADLAHSKFFSEDSLGFTFMLPPERR